MIIVLKPRTTEENVSRVVHLIENKGLDTHIVRGSEMTIIGCIGDTTAVDPKLFEVDSSVDKVMHVQEPYKLANRAFHPENSVIDVSGVKVGGGHMAMIAGPCSVESYEQVLEIARAAKASGANMLRGGAFKPRSSPYSFQGLGLEGLDILCAVKDEVGHPHVRSLYQEHAGLAEHPGTKPQDASAGRHRPEPRGWEMVAGGTDGQGRHRRRGGRINHRGAQQPGVRAVRRGAIAKARQV